MRSHTIISAELLLLILLGELVSQKLPLLLIALATVLVLLLPRLELPLEALLNDPGIGLRLREVTGNRRQSVLGHVLDLNEF